MDIRYIPISYPLFSDRPVIWREILEVVFNTMDPIFLGILCKKYRSHVDIVLYCRVFCGKLGVLHLKVRTRLSFPVVNLWIIAILMRILQPQTESGPRNYCFIFFHFVFHFFPVSYHSPIMWNFHFHFFHSPIMWKCHSHLFIVFPSCAVNIIMCILVPSRLVDTQRKTSKSKTQKLRPQPQFLWGRNSRLLQVRIRLTLVN